LPRWLSLALKALAVLFVSLFIGVNAELVYTSSYYERFFVNGLSMSPTLNSDVKVYGPSGEEESASGDFNLAGRTYICDYGVLDSHKAALDSLERFDIVVTYFPGDYENGVLKEGAGLKIKRVIGLPNETLYYSAGHDGHEAGDLVVDGVLTPEPFLASESLKALTLKGTGSESYYATESRPLTLKEDEFFLVGDNRNVGASDDSRKEGPVMRSEIVGKAVAIIGRCVYTVDSGEAKLDLSALKMPWEYKFL